MRKFSKLDARSVLEIAGSMRLSFDDRLAEAEAMFRAGRYSEVLTQLATLMPEAVNHRPAELLAETLLKLGMTGEAAEAFEHAGLKGAPHPYPLLLKAARLYLDAGRMDKALSLAVQLSRHQPNDPAPAFIIASIGLKAGQPGLLAEPIKNLLVDSDDPEHLRLAVQLIGDDLRNAKNLTLFAKLRRLYLDDPFIRMTLVGYAREFCDYPILLAEEEVLRADIASGDTRALAAETPHYNLMWCADEVLNRIPANITGLVPFAADAPARRRAKPHVFAEKIRVGYLSNDFWADHATMRLLGGVLKAHDRDRFDVTLYCHTPERFIGGDAAVRAEWGRITRIEDMSDEEAIATMQSDRIDVLVDLKGHTGGSRSRLMNAPVAPVHVAWLGFPGSSVGVDCDYVIGDRFVLPDSARPHYHEKFCRMPESYQPNDPWTRIVPGPAARRSYGLPTDRFIFSAFNSQRKNGSEGIGLWARVLVANPDAVLWLMVDGTHARNATADFLRRAGVRSDQFIFASKMPYSSHLARVPAADIGLDSFPYNGHTTTSDMLWAGLPVVTRKGTNFASRVSESLLNAIGLPELVAEDADAFVALCSALVSDRERVTRLRRTIADNRFVAPLFDAERFCRHLEWGYSHMVERAKAGLAPDHFDVPALEPRTVPFRTI